MRWRNLRMPAVLRFPVRSDVAPDVNKLGQEAREYIWTTGGLCNRAVRLIVGSVPSWINSATENSLKGSSTCAAELSGAASDPATSTRLTRLIRELEHSLREIEEFPA